MKIHNYGKDYAFQQQLKAQQTEESKNEVQAAETPAPETAEAPVTDNEAKAMKEAPESAEKEMADDANASGKKRKGKRA